jgi:flagellar biosynthesis protein FliR
MDDKLFELPFRMLENLGMLWTYVLLTIRYTGMFMTIPGIGAGGRGLPIRLPAILVFAFASFRPERVTPVPEDPIIVAAQVLSEIMVGAFIGVIPQLIVSGAQCAGQIASGTMGLNGSGMFDPSTNSSIPDIAKFYGELTGAMFLLVGGHHVALYTLATLSDSFLPGTFLTTEQSIGVLVDRTAMMFSSGIMIASPVIVALLLTNFVMGLLSKAVPTVSVMAVSFPITITVGLALTALSLGEVMHYVRNQMVGLEGAWGVLLGR